MKRFMSRVGRQFRYGEKGFTLIELLVVIAILGIIAAVVMLYIGVFSDRGKEEAANTEAHQVLTAIILYMEDNSLTTFNGVVGSNTSSGPEAYLMDPAPLQARYIAVNATLVGAILEPGSKWAGCNFTNGTWDCP